MKHVSNWMKPQKDKVILDMIRRKISTRYNAPRRASHSKSPAHGTPFSRVCFKQDRPQKIMYPFFPRTEYVKRRNEGQSSNIKQIWRILLTTLNKSKRTGTPAFSCSYYCIQIAFVSSPTIKKRDCVLSPFQNHPQTKYANHNNQRQNLNIY